MTGQTRFPGPTPAYTNPPITPQFYNPSRFVISALTYGDRTTVTTSVNHNYVVGNLTRLVIPSPFGAYQLNEQEGYVTSIPAANQVVVTVYSKGAEPFRSTSLFPTSPEILAIGDINTGNIGTQGRTSVPTNIPGAFINVSE